MSDLCPACRHEYEVCECPYPEQVTLYYNCVECDGMGDYCARCGPGDPCRCDYIKVVCAECRGLGHVEVTE